MNTSYPTLSELDNFLQNELATDRYPDTEKGGIYYPSDRPVRRIGLALEPFADLPNWLEENHLDALWLHRPWRLDLESIPSDVGVLSYHLPFDEALTLGYNERLARQLGATQIVTSLGHKQATDKKGEPLPKRPIGMVIDIAEQEFDDLLQSIKDIFGGYDRAEAGIGELGWQPNSRRIAVVGAMNDTLIREAAEQQAQLYLTGAYRKPAQAAVDETGIAVAAVGHYRVEEWGLQALADLLLEHWAIECVIYRQPVKP